MTDTSLARALAYSDKLRSFAEQTELRRFAVEAERAARTLGLPQAFKNLGVLHDAFERQREFSKQLAAIDFRPATNHSTIRAMQELAGVVRQLEPSNELLLKGLQPAIADAMQTHQFVLRSYKPMVAEALEQMRSFEALVPKAFVAEQVAIATALGQFVAATNLPQDLTFPTVDDFDLEDEEQAKKGVRSVCDSVRAFIVALEESPVRRFLFHCLLVAIIYPLWLTFYQQAQSAEADERQAAWNRAVSAELETLTAELRRHLQEDGGVNEIVQV